MYSTLSDHVSGSLGHGVKIGVVDSGIIADYKNANIAGGIGIYLDKQNTEKVEYKSDYEDHLGHGTACAGIIGRKAPQAEVYPVRIFHRDWATDTGILCAGIQWCIDNGMHLINLSLGTIDPNALDELENVCKQALENNVIIVAGMSEDSQRSYPACLSSVYGVIAGKNLKGYEYYFNPTAEAEFVARGDRQRVDWIGGKQAFVAGSSFAVPHIVGILAQFLQKDRFFGSSISKRHDVLERFSLSQRPEPAEPNNNLKFYSTQRSTKKLSDVYKKTDVSGFKEAAIYPYNKEMHSLVRFPELLPFKIKHVVDVTGRLTIGKDSGELIGGKRNEIPIERDLESIVEDSDSLILGYLDEVSRIRKQNLLKDALELALKYKTHVFSLTPIATLNEPRLIQEFRDNNVQCLSPTITDNDFLRITQNFNWQEPSQVPIVGIFGTGSQQGKFTAQLVLRKALEEKGIRIGQLGTEHQSPLFGFDFTFPNGYNAFDNIQIPMEAHIQFLHAIMKGIEHNNPDLIIVGGQSNVVPYSYAQRSQLYTLTTLITVMGTVPDAYILVVNANDEEDYIRDTIQVLEGLGNGKVILLMFSDKMKEVSMRFGKPQTKYRPLNSQELVDTKIRLETDFKLPAIPIVGGESEKLSDCITGYFS